jgi:hypothetical protein
MLGESDFFQTSYNIGSWSKLRVTNWSNFAFLLNILSHYMGGLFTILCRCREVYRSGNSSHYAFYFKPVNNYLVQT